MKTDKRAISLRNHTWSTPSDNGNEASNHTASFIRKSFPTKHQKYYAFAIGGVDGAVQENVDDKASLSPISLRIN